MPQSLSQVILHVIFSTAERKFWLDETIRDRAQAYIATLLRDADFYSWKSTRWNMMNVTSGIGKGMKRSFRGQYLFCICVLIPQHDTRRGETFGRPPKGGTTNTYYPQAYGW